MTTLASALEMRGINKSFTGNSVLVDVNLSARAGEVHALVGENGAGKSTLMKILAGVYQPDAGTILIDGREVSFARPSDALADGIAMIYQELSLAPELTVAENIFLGREPLSFAPFGVVNRREMNARATGMLKEYGFKIDPRTIVKRLSAADRQLVEITRATVEAKRVLVMDEPTSSLTAHEVTDLFRLIRELKARGLAIIYISHRLEELDFIADRLTVLRDGRAVYSGSWGELSRADIIRHMAGRELKEIFPPRAAGKGDVRLRVVARCQIIFYLILGGLAGLAGAIEAARLVTGQPTAGEGYELRVIAAVVIGGGSLSGGQGTVIGTIIGALIMGVLANGANLLGISSFTQQIVIGAVIVLAVTFDQFQRRRLETAGS